MDAKDYLLSAHWFFDFTWSEWLVYWTQRRDEDPFKRKIFRFYPSQNMTARSWEEAFDISQRYADRRLTPYCNEWLRDLLTRGAQAPVLYLRGNTDMPNYLSLISVVGTRFATPKGLRAAHQYTEHFVNYGMGTVSGLARGIDSVAHEGTLKNEGMTIAVMGSGLDNIYPKENQDLAMRIATQGGLLLSEFPPHVEPRNYFFPRRNRLIATMAAGVVVIEAPPKSGAQITAKLALEQNIPVCVLPRDFDSDAGEGASLLIRDGAWPCLSPHDCLLSIAQNYGNSLRPLKAILPLPKQTFTLKEFQSLYGLGVGESLAHIQRLLEARAIREIAADLFEKCH